MGIKLKRSAVASKVPVITDIELGELAVNTWDGKLYLKKNDGMDAIVEVGPVRSVAGRTGAVALGIADVASLQTVLDGKQAAGSYAAVSHSHVIANVTGLQTALDGKADDSEITTLTTSLNAKITAPASLAQGDVLYYNGSAWARLAAGTSGHVLKTRGAGQNPVFEAGGSWELIGTYVASSSASLDVTNLGAFRAIRVLFNSLRPATDGASLRFHYTTNNGTNWNDGDAVTQSIQTVDSGVSGIDDAWGISPTGAIGNNATSDAPVNGFILLTNFGIAAFCGFVGQLVWADTTGNSTFRSFGGNVRLATARNGIRASFSSGNITSGSITVEGIRA